MGGVFGSGVSHLDLVFLNTGAVRCVGESGLSLLFFGEHQTKPQNDARLNGEDYRNSFYSCAVGPGDPLEKKPGDPPD